MKDQQRTAAGSTLRGYETPKLQYLGSLSQLTASGSAGVSESTTGSSGNPCTQNNNRKVCTAVSTYLPLACAGFA